MKKYLKIGFVVLFLLIITYQIIVVQKRSGFSIKNQLANNNSTNVLANSKTGAVPFLLGINPEEIESFLEKIIYEDKAQEHEKERWVYFNEGEANYLTEQYLPDNRILNGIRDTLYTAIPFKHEAWIGGSLGYYTSGNGSELYKFPLQVYGYEIVNIGDIFVNNVRVENFSYQKTPTNWEIRFPTKVNSENLIQIGFWVGVKQVQILLDPEESLRDFGLDDIQSLVETKVISLTLQNDAKIFEVEGHPPFPKNAKNEPIIFVDGKPVIVSWEIASEKNRLRIHSSEILRKGQKIEIPFLFSIEFSFPQ